MLGEEIYEDRLGQGLRRDVEEGRRTTDCGPGSNQGARGKHFMKPGWPRGHYQVCELQCYNLDEERSGISGDATVVQRPQSRHLST